MQLLTHTRYCSLWTSHPLVCTSYTNDHICPLCAVGVSVWDSPKSNNIAVYLHGSSAMYLFSKNYQQNPLNSSLFLTARKYNQLTELRYNMHADIYSSTSIDKEPFTKTKAILINRTTI